MFTIRNEQMDVLGTDFRHRFHCRLMVMIRKNLPRQTAGLDDPTMLGRIAAADIKAGTYGIVSERGIGQFVSLSFLAGPNFDELPKVQPYMKDPRIEPQHKIDTLFDYVVERGRYQRGD